MRPRLGFLGVGWIGRHRLEAIAAAGSADVVAIADPSHERRDAALALAPAAIGCEHLGQLLEQRLDGIVIATPSAQHADQALLALNHGLAVFCQKPLGRSADETARVVEAARRTDRLLGVDLSYRHTAAARQLRGLVRDGHLGRVFAIDLVFHNAYGPEAGWFYDKSASGGGCVMDLGIHLVDLALWLLDFPGVEAVDSRLFSGGEPIDADSPCCEDFATATIGLAGGAAMRLACSWRLSAGRDAVIEASLYGSAGAAALKNLGGSFFDFVAERYRGTKTEELVGPPDAWGGRAAVAWTEQLARSAAFDPEASRLVDVAQVLDRIYRRGAPA